MPATIDLPAGAPPCCEKRIGGYVHDTLAAHNGGGPTPPCVIVAGIYDGAVTLDVIATGRTLDVPVGGPVPLPGCPGWSAVCHGADYADGVAWVHLTRDEPRPAPAPARVEPAREEPEDVILDLGPTAVYARREAAWVPGKAGEGVLTITLWKGMRAGSKSERDVYQVQETDCVGRMGRSFLLLNVFDTDQPDVYAATVGPTCGCTCRAGLVARFECKHVSACKRLTQEGRL